jgi:hypothetical protein
MTDGDGMYDEMRHLPTGPDRFRSDPLALDEGTAERLLAGSMDPADAPPAYRRVAMVLAAASAKPGPEELASEARAVRSLAKVARSVPHRAPSRRSSVLSKVLTLKAAMVAATATVVLAGVAGAATGTLPDPAQRVADKMIGAKSHAQDDHASGASSQSSASHATGAQNSAAPKGPDATGSAKEGLCQAWQSGQGGEEGKKDDSTAFKAVAAAAGGADKVADFCKDVTPAGSDHAQSTPPSTTPEQSHGGASQGGGDGQDNGQSGGTPADSRPQPTQPTQPQR